MSAGPQPPKVLTDVGLNMFVDVAKLRQLDIPIVDVPISELVWHFDMPVWAKDKTDDWNLTPQEVIDRKENTSDHQKRVARADTSYPIVVTHYNGRLVILDGVHRLVKVYQRGGDVIKAKLIPGYYLTQAEYRTD